MQSQLCELSLLYHVSLFILLHTVLYVYQIYYYNSLLSIIILLLLELLLLSLLFLLLTEAESIRH